MTIKQFKLTNNEEIICEIMEWDTGDETGDILVKKALRVISVEEPVTKITGDLSPLASNIAGTAFANPSGPTKHTAGFRDILV